jgi:hypothetical protein
METAYPAKQKIRAKDTGPTARRVAQAPRLIERARHPQTTQPGYQRMGQLLPIHGGITDFLQA